MISLCYIFNQKNKGDSVPRDGKVKIMKIAVAGTGYVGLVTGVALANAGHHVTCVDVDPKKIETMRQGISPFMSRGWKS